MASLSISQVAAHIHLRPSTIRYYEQIGLLMPPARISGQRRFDRSAVHRLALIRQAVQAGFTLGEIRRLFYGFGQSFPASRRWQQMAQTKRAEIKRQIEILQNREKVLRHATDCHCVALDECAEHIHRQSFGEKIGNQHGPAAAVRRPAVPPRQASRN